MKPPKQEHAWPYNLLYAIFNMDISDVRWYDLNDDAPVRLLGAILQCSEVFERNKKGTGERNMNILFAYYQHSRPVADIAKEFGMHKQTVRHVLDRYLEMLQHPSRSIQFKKAF